MCGCGDDTIVRAEEDPFPPEDPSAVEYRDGLRSDYPTPSPIIVPENTQTVNQFLGHPGTCAYPCPVCEPDKVPARTTGKMPELAMDFGPSLLKMGENEYTAIFGASSAPNPKTLMGRLKLPVLSVIPAAAILREAEAMRYGAFEAPRVDGGKGYGPYNWREQDVEYMTYIDATMRHCMQAVEGEDLDPVTKAMHLAHARASLGILIDAIDNGTVIDNRPVNRKQIASKIIDEAKEKLK